jgi:hypothetical protein
MTIQQHISEYSPYLSRVTAPVFWLRLVKARRQSGGDIGGLDSEFRV